MRSLYSHLRRRFGPRISSAERRSHVEKKINGLRKRFAAVDATQRRTARPASKRPDVVIIGGGFAGLMAGHTLAKHCNVTIFEARDRVGGRVSSQNLNGSIIEAGGELIGYNHPQWLLLAKQFELGLSVLSSDDNYDALDLDMPLYLDGELLSETKMNNIYDEMNVAFDKMSRQAEVVANPYKPWLAPHAARLDAMPLSEWISKLSCSRLTKLAIESQFSNDGGAPTDRQSYLASLAVVRGGALHGKPDDYFNVTEVVRCSQGNQALALSLEKSIIDAGGVVYLSRPVRKIRIVKDEVTIEPESGRAVTADYVILAIPPSLWPASPRARIEIDPPLSPDYSVTMGTAVKYLSSLDRRFWIADGLAPTATSDQFGVIWEGTDNQIAAPGHSVELSLFAGAGVAQAALGAFQRGGVAAVRQFYDRRIGRIYRHYVESCTQASFVAWPLEQWTAGGYSCAAPGEVCRAGPLLDRAFKDRLFFAGEHACPAFYGYMEGALQSGKTAASKVLKEAV